ncbi:MAG: helix-turn-helix domain-containing protein, partial [Candidatus Eremiobacteraeota bacterium]|nr:helix-turn-helix domain-containing protein [Candidatus Eremiobacteraeota bacterium]
AELVGLVWIVEGESKLSELDSRAAEHAALVAALHVAHQRELASMESRLGYASFLSLLQADEDDPQAVERARLLGFEPDGVHRIGMALLSEPLPLTREGFLRRERLASSLRGRLRALGTRPLLTTTLNYVAFLLPEGIDVDAFWRGMNSSNGDSVSLVLGRPHRGTQGARRSYREAQSLVNYRDPKKIRRFEEALVPRVLMGDTGAHEAFIDHLFGPLSKVKGGETLKRVLLALAKNGFNLKQTAESLHIHTNTLRYRLARSLDVLKIDLDDPEVRFQLQLAVRIIDFSNSKEPGG